VQLSFYSVGIDYLVILKIRKILLARNILNILSCLIFFVNSSVSSLDCPLFHHSVEVEAQIPLRLREGDIIIMGTTELMVHVTNLEDLENFPPEDLVQQN
jgi:hypothetical protein